MVPRRKDSKLEFTPMDGFIGDILAALEEHGSRAIRVFPAEANVLLSFADKLANEVVSARFLPCVVWGCHLERGPLCQVGEYISSLLTRAREISNEIFLKASAASFKESWRMVDIIMHIASTKEDLKLPKTKAEDVV